MRYAQFSTPDDLVTAARLAHRTHEQLRSRLPFLPARSPADFAPRIEWMTRHGIVLGRFAGTELTSFLGAFPIDRFRNAGKGSFGPDWCHGQIASEEPGTTCRELYRELAPRLMAMDCRIHAFAFHATEKQAIDALRLTGFGHIVLDAARPTGELLAALPEATPEVEIHRAEPGDAETLAGLDALLAEHIAAAPVLMPAPRGRDRDQWTDWLGSPARIALLARIDGRTAGFIKAEEPQFDVSYAVHDRVTLAINGMLVHPAFRRHGVGTALLAALAHQARASDKTLVSVDCETTNIEAFSFWTRWFEPVSWSLERRV